jgi:NADH:ubiquinone oxidoreductase subunit 6 (subunit J)
VTNLGYAAMTLGATMFVASGLGFYVLLRGHFELLREQRNSRE